jgi:hypothetical protein
VLACVAARPVTGRVFAHWAVVAGKAGEHKRSAIVRQVMGFLLSSEWVIGEAANLHIDVSDEEVRRAFDRIHAQQFHTRGEFAAFLRSTGETVPDLLFRVRLNLLSSAIQRAVLAGQPTPAAREAALGQFVLTFGRRWRAQTTCVPAYAVSDCGLVTATL